MYYLLSPLINWQQWPPPAERRPAWRRVSKMAWSHQGFCFVRSNREPSTAQSQFGKPWPRDQWICTRAITRARWKPQPHCVVLRTA